MNHPFLIGNCIANKILLPVLVALACCLACGTAHAQAGAALHFDGSNDVVNNITGISLNNSSFTVEFWCRRTNNNGSDMVLGQGTIGTNTSLHVGFVTGNTFRFGFYQNDLDVTHSDFVWHHWACVYQAGMGAGVNDRFIYRDGVLVASDNSASNYLGTGNISIGAASFGANFLGEIDEVRIWTRALCAAEILAHKNCEITIAQTGLQANYHFNQGTAGANNAGVTTLTDASGNGRNGTLANFALTGATSNWITPGGVTTGTTCSFPVNIACPSNISQNATTGQCTRVVTYAATGTDACGNAATMTYSPASGSTFGLGTTTVTATATDAGGNTATCTFTVTISDAQAPAITCAANVTQAVAAGTCAATVTVGAPTVTDNCNVNNNVAMDFDAGNYGTAANMSANVLGSKTIEGWFRLDNVTGNKNMFGFRNDANFDFYILALGNRIEARIRNNAGTAVTLNTAAGSLVANTWYHVAMTWDGSTLRLYLNGSLVTSASATGTQTLTTQDLTLGRHSAANAANPLSGQLDEVRLWNTARTAAEISANYRKMMTGNESGLVAYYNFSEGTACGNNAARTTFLDVASLNGVNSLTISGGFVLNGGCTSNYTNVLPVLGFVNSVNGTADASGTYNAGVNTITWTATDASGNTATCTQTVTVTEAVAPTITCPANITQAAAAGVCTAAVTFAATATDNCTTPTLSYSPASGAAFNQGTTTVTATATDASGNTATCTFTVTVTDAQAPTITCAANMTQAVAVGTCAATVTVTAPTVTDNCGANNDVALDFDSGNYASVASMSAFVLGSKTIEGWFRVDNVANPKCLFGFRNDNNFDYYVLALGNRVEARLRNSGGTTYTLTSAVGSLTSNTWYHVAFTWDGSTIKLYLNSALVGTLATTGTQSLATQAFTFGRPNPGNTSFPLLGVVDEVRLWNTARTAAEISANYRKMLLGNETGLVAYYNFSEGTACGNNAARTTFSDIAALNGYNDATFAGGFLLNGGCASNYTNVLPTLGLVNSINGTADASGSYNVGTTVITWTATDASGNTATCTQSVTVTEAVAPTITCPANITQTLGAGVCSVAVTYAATATDNCGTPTLFYNPASGSTFKSGVTTVTVTANDGNGNTSTCTFSVTINDTQSPTITCPANITTTAPIGACSAVLTVAAPTYSDNCPVNSAAMDFNYGNYASVANASTFVTGSKTIEGWFNTEDIDIKTLFGFKNDVNFDFYLLQYDTHIEARFRNSAGTAYTVNSSNFISVNTWYHVALVWNGTTLTLYVNGALAGSTATTGTQSLTTQDFAMGAASAAGLGYLYTGMLDDVRLWNTARTAAQIATNYNRALLGTEANLVMYFNFEEGTPCGNNTGITSFRDHAALNGTNSATPAGGFALNGSCNSNYTNGSLPITGVYNSFTANASGNGTYPVGTTNVTWTATDATGNTATCLQTVTVTDVQAPTITCPANISQTAVVGQCAQVVTYAATATDLCGTASLTYSPVSGSSFNLGTTVVTITATDASGNTATCTFTVTISETQAPTIACPANISQNTDLGFCTASVTVPSATTSDNCIINNTAAADFDSGNKATVTDLSGQLLGNKTIEGWFRVDDVATFKSLFGFRNDINYAFYVLVLNNAIEARIRNSAGTISNINSANGSIVANTWYHVALTWDGSNIALYLNGTLVGTTPATGTHTNATEDFIMGTSYEGIDAYPLFGQLDEVRVWNTARTQAEIAANYRKEMVGNESGLLAYFNFDEGSPCGNNTGRTSFTDKAFLGGSNNATIGGGFVLNGGCSSNYTSVMPVLGLVNSFTGTDDASGAYPVGTTNVTWTATDASGNTATCSQTVTVTDNQAPTITCPANVTVNADANTCGATLAITAPTVSNNCPLNEVSIDFNTGNYASLPNASGMVLGTKTIEGWFKADNVASIKNLVGFRNNTDFDFYLVQYDNHIEGRLRNSDGTAFTVNSANVIQANTWYHTALTWDGDTVALYLNGNLVDTAATTGAQVLTTQDFALGVVSVTNPVNAFAGVMDEIRMWNTARTAAEISMHYNRPILGTEPGLVIYYNFDEGTPCGNNTGITPFLDHAALGGLNNATPAGGFVLNGTCNSNYTNVSAPITGIHNSFTYNGSGNGTYPVGTTNVTWTATDASGNTASCSQTVTVIDNQLPYFEAINCDGNFTIVISGPDFLDEAYWELRNYYNTPIISGGNYVRYSTNTINIAANEGPFTFYLETQGNFNDNIVNYTVACGGDTLVSGTLAGGQTLTEGNLCCSGTPIYGVANISLNADAGQCSAVATYNALAADNCGVTISYSTPSGSAFNVGTTPVTITATDPSGNTASMSFTVTVTDTQSPVITCPANVTVNTDPGLCSAAVTVAMPTVSDNCYNNALNFDGVNDNVAVATGLPAMADFTVECWIKPTLFNGDWRTIFDYDLYVSGALHLQIHPSNTIEFALGGGINAYSTYTVTPNTWQHIAVVFSSTNDYVKFYLNGTLVNTVTYTGSTTLIGGAPWHIGAWISSRYFGGSMDELRIWNTERSTAQIQALMNNTLAGNESGLVAYYPFNQGVSGANNAGVTTLLDMAPDNGATNGVLNNFALNGNTSNWLDNLLIVNNFNNGTDASGTYPVGTTNVIWTATDASGNTSTCSQTVTVVDNQAPVITCPTNINANVTAGLCTATISFAATATDNCGVSSVVYAPASGTVFNVGTSSVLVTATDVNGNTSTCSFTVTVVDNQMPVITCPANINIDAVAGQCSAVVTFTTTATDNCGSPTITFSPASGTSFYGGNTTVTATADDGNGNTSTCTFVVTVNDTESPTISCGSNITQNNDAGLCAANVTVVSPFVTDNCYTPGNALNFDGTNDYVATGNVDFNNSSVTVEAWIKPTTFNNYMRIVEQSYINSFYFGCTSGSNDLSVWMFGNQWAVTTGGAITPGQWQHVAFTFDKITHLVKIYVNGILKVTGNTGFTGLTASLPLFLGKQFNSNSGYFNGSMDEVRVWSTTRTQAQIQACMYNEITGSPAGLVARYSMNQGVARGNNAGLTTMINDQGNATSNGTLNNFLLNTNRSNWVGGAAPLVGYTLTNNINGTDDATGLYPVGNTTVSWTVVDSFGNSATCSQTVTVVDNQVPAITCPTNISVNAAAGICTATVTYAATTTDNCGVASVVHSPASGSTFNFGVTNVLVTATDVNGNTSSCTFTVTVNDNQVPTITCPANITLNADAGLCTAVVTFAATAADNCGTATISYSHVSGAAFNKGTTTVTATANDGHGNTSTCSFTITVNDNQAPSIACAANVTQNAAAGTCAANVTVTSPTVNDNCIVAGNALNFDGVNDDIDIAINPSETAYTAELWFKTTTASCGIMMHDGLINGHNGSNDRHIYLNNGNIKARLWNNEIISTTGTNYADGNWHHVAYTFGTGVGPQRIYVDGILKITGTLAVSSWNGNSINIGFSSDANPAPYFNGTIDEVRIWNVARTQAQIVADMYRTLPAGTSGLIANYRFDQGIGGGNNAGLTTAINDQGAVAQNGTLFNFALNGNTSNWVTSTSPMSGYTLTNSFNGSTNASGSYPVGTTIVTWTATDLAGNTSTCTQSVTVLDVQVPTVTCPANITLAADAGLCTRANVTFAATATDNCGGTTLSYSPASGSTFNLGATTVVTTATDASGNTSTCSFRVTITDTQAPSISCPGNITTAAAAGDCGANVTYSATATDLCGAATLSYNYPSGSYFGVGTTTVIATATDASGNTSTCTFSVIVTDGQAPTITCPANITANVVAGTCASNVTVPSPTSTDNCNHALNFDNLDDKVVVANGPALNNQSFTVEFWAKRVTDASGGYVVTQGTTSTNNGLHIGFRNNTQFTMAFYGNDLNVNVPNDNNWHHYACTYDATIGNATDRYIYMDGALMGSDNATANYTGTGALNIGTRFSPGVNEYFNGDVDEVRVWNVARTQAQIQASYNTRLVGNEANLICYYNFDEGIACGTNTGVTTLYDRAGGDNNGTLTNMALAGGCTSNWTAGAPAVVTYTNSFNNTSNASGSYPVGTTTVVWTATDQAGNTATCSHTVTVVDNQPPVITCPSNVVATADAGQCTTVVIYAPATATDVCGTPTFTYSSPSGSLFSTGTTIVTVTANDGNGNTATCSFTVTVSDAQAPSITCPANITQNADAGACTAAVTVPLPVVTDNCVVNNAVAMDFDNGNYAKVASFSGQMLGNETIECWFKADNVGGFQNLVGFRDDNFYDFYVLLLGNRVEARFRNQAGAFIDIRSAVGSIAANTWYHLAFTWNGTNTFLYINGVLVGTASATGVHTRTNLDLNIGLAYAGIGPGAYQFLGQMDEIRLWNVARTQAEIVANMKRNLLGNEAGLVAYYDFSEGSPCGDNTGRTYIADMAYSSGYNNAVFGGGFALNGGCSSNYTNEMPPLGVVNSYNGTANASGTYPVGTTNVTWTATDASGNTATCVQTITVVDNQAPSISCPSNIVLNANAGGCSTTATFAATASDNCGATNITYSPASGSVFNVGTSIVTATANDGHGNTATCTFTVTVNDIDAPTISCPGNQSVSGFAQALLPNYTNLASTTDCSPVSLSQSPAANTVYNTNQTVTVTLTATDAAGNTANCSFDVSITIFDCGPSTRIYVDDNATGSNNGTSWNNAFTSLNSALAVATAGFEIWVKEGTYRPTNTMDRLVSFELKPDVAIYGGFPQSADCNTPLVDRNPALYESILSGDIGTLGLNTDNSVCIVRAYNVGSNAILDGFVIRDAYCNSNQRPAPFMINADGPGIVSSPIVNQCILRNNYNANNGGAMCFRALNGATTAPTLTDCIFRLNNAAFDGGAVFSTSKFTATVNATFNTCTFENNTAVADGGAVYQWMSAYCNSNLTFNDCSFLNNTAGSDGGAIWNYGLKSTSGLTFNNTHFADNTSVRGGALFQTMTTSISSVALTGCTLDGNSASSDGGALYIYGDKSNIDNVTVHQTAFTSNTSQDRGGAVFMYNLGGASVGTGYFENCIFYNNSSVSYGAGLGVYARSLSNYNTTLLHCTFNGNHSNTFGGAVGNYITQVGSISNVTLQNCAVWGNTAASGKPFYGQNVGATTNFNDGILDNANCALNETGTGAFNCAGLIALDPLFVDAANGDLHLSANSPAIDAGGPGSLVDFDGAARPSGNGFDIGAFEYGGIVPRLAPAATPANPSLLTLHASLNIFPNPTSDRFTVQLEEHTDAVVEIMDMQGRVILSTSLQGSDRAELSLSGHSSGTYLVRVTTPAGTQVGKVQLHLP